MKININNKMREYIKEKNKLQITFRLNFVASRE